MTTAARPTFDSAKGGSGLREREISKLTQLVSSRDLPGHLTLKERKQGQDTNEEVTKRDLVAELLAREQNAQLEKVKGDRSRYVPSLEQTATLRLAIKAERDRERVVEKDALLDGDSEILTMRSSFDTLNYNRIAQIDADEDFGEIDDSESDFEEDEEDPVELMAELDRIKQERLAEGRQSTKKELISDTPSSYSLKRRWDDDVPFKNCAREDKNSKKPYLNDTLRQEFHKKFMDKYIK